MKKYIVQSIVRVVIRIVSIELIECTSIITLGFRINCTDKNRIPEAHRMLNHRVNNF